MTLCIIGYRQSKATLSTFQGKFSANLKRISRKLTKENFNSCNDIMKIFPVNPQIVENNTENILKCWNVSCINLRSFKLVSPSHISDVLACHNNLNIFLWYLKFFLFCCSMIFCTTLVHMKKLGWKCAYCFMYLHFIIALFHRTFKALHTHTCVFIYSGWLDLCSGWS